MTSPSSRLIMATRAPSRFSSDISGQFFLIHPHRCAARKEAVIVLGDLRQYGAEILSFGLGGVGQHRDVACVRIQLEHCQNLEPIETLNPCAEDDQVGEHLLDL